VVENVAAGVGEGFGLTLPQGAVVVAVDGLGLGVDEGGDGVEQRGVVEPGFDAPAGAVRVAGEEQLVDRLGGGVVGGGAVLVQPVDQGAGPPGELGRGVGAGLGGERGLGAGPHLRGEPPGGGGGQGAGDHLDVAQRAPAGGEHRGGGLECRGEYGSVEPDPRAHVLGGGDAAGGVGAIPAEQIGERVDGLGEQAVRARERDVHLTPGTEHAARRFHTGSCRFNNAPEVPMPAVTVSDVLTLPRVPQPDPTALARPVRTITTAPSGVEGEGFPVRRAFAGVDLRDLDPFLHMDQMGEVEYAPGEPKGTSWHPHRGFETVTYIIDGTFEHQDSHGGGGSITNGDTQWMTAGSGLLHIERPPEALVASGGLFHGLQLWVNLPRADKWLEPKYQDLRAGGTALLTTPDGGALIRVIAGELAGHTGPGSTYTPMAMMHATISPGAELRLPWRRDFNALVYVLSGAGGVGSEHRPVQAGQLAVFGPGDTITVAGANRQESRLAGLDVVILGGRPIREPVAWAGPFVMNTEAEVLQAFEDYQKGRLGVVPATYVPHGGR
jgi:quercetin 2,3-dioxygenase